MAVLHPYSCHLKVAQDTSSLAAHDASVPDLRGARIAVHLGELQLGLGAHARRERRVADDVSERLPVGGTRRVSIGSSTRKETARGVDATGVEWRDGEEKEDAHLSVSNCSKTLRLVWSRMVRALTKQPRSSFLARNMDMLAVVGVCDVGERRRARSTTISRRACHPEQEYGDDSRRLRHRSLSVVAQRGW